jgi:hypothetical protein
MTTYQTKVEDLHQGDTVQFEGRRWTVVRNIRERDGAHTVQLQIPGSQVRTIHDSYPGFVFTRIGF